MRDADGRFGLVDFLAAGSGRAEQVDAQFFRLDFHFADFLDLGQHGHGRGGSMDAALGFGFRHALHAVPAAFVAQDLVDVRAFHGKDDFLEPAQIGRRRVDHARLPALGIRETRIHPEQVAREQGGFLAAGARADFQDRVAAVVGIRRQHQRHERAFGARNRGFQFLFFRARDFGQFRIVGGIGQQFGVAGQLLPQALQFVRRPGQVPQALVLAHHLLERAGIGGRAGHGHRLLELLGAGGDLAKIGGIHFHGNRSFGRRYAKRAGRSRLGEGSGPSRTIATSSRSPSWRSAC